MVQLSERVGMDIVTSDELVFSLFDRTLKNNDGYYFEVYGNDLFAMKRYKSTMLALIEKARRIAVSHSRKKQSFVGAIHASSRTTVVVEPNVELRQVFVHFFRRSFPEFPNVHHRKCSLDGIVLMRERPFDTAKREDTFKLTDEEWKHMMTAAEDTWKAQNLVYH